MRKKWPFSLEQTKISIRISKEQAEEVRRISAIRSEHNWYNRFSPTLRYLLHLGIAQYRKYNG